MGLFCFISNHTYSLYMQKVDTDMVDTPIGVWVLVCHCVSCIPHKVNQKKVLNVIPNHQPETMGGGVRYIDYNFNILFYPKLFLILSLFFVCTVVGNFYYALIYIITSLFILFML